MILFAAEVATETSYFVLVDECENTLFERLAALIDFVDDEDYTESSGTVICKDFDDGVELIRLGQWSYSQRV